MDRRTPLTKRVAIYARVSTADKNQTVENQLRDLLAVAGRQDWEVVATFTDEGCCCSFSHGALVESVGQWVARAGQALDAA